MASKNRRARTSTPGYALTTSPSEQSQVIPREVPKVTSALAGMDGLSDVFRSFSNQMIAGIDQFRQGAMIAERGRIEQENKQQKSQAVGDFYAGRDMDPALTDDLDYYDTYRGLLAIRTGNDAAVEFEKFYREQWLPANPQGDLQSAREQYIKDNLAGGEDPDFEGQAIGSFIKATDPLVGTQRENAVRIQIEQGKQNLTAAFNAEAASGDITPERLQWYINAARTLDPLNPHEAAPFIATAVQSAIKNNPGKTSVLLDLLNQPGTGINGKSYAESFPEAYMATQEKALVDWESINTMEEWNIIDGFNRRADKLQQMTEDEIDQFTVDLATAASKGVARGEIRRLEHSIATEINRRVEQGVNHAAVDASLFGGGPFDTTAVRKGLSDPAYIQKRLGVDNILKADPFAAAELLIRGKGVVPEDIKYQVSSALLSYENPQLQVRAIGLLNALQSGRNKEFADEFLTDDASRYFDQVAFSMINSDQPAEAIVQRINEERRNIDFDTDWKDYGAGDSPEKAKVAVKDQISSAVHEKMEAGGFIGLGGYDVVIPPDLEQAISDYGLSIARERSKQGVSWDTAINDAVNRLSTRMSVIPQDGRYVLSIDTDLPPEWKDANGEWHMRVKMSFAATNPKTGKKGNTVAVYEEQLADLETRFRPLLPTGSKDSVTLSDAYPQVNAMGSYAVMQDGNPIVFDVGDEIEFDVPVAGLFQADDSLFMANDFKQLMENPKADRLEKRKVKFTENPAEWEGAFENLPEGFVFVYHAPTNGWMLAYQPNFGEEGGMTLEDRAIKFDKENK